VSPSRPLATLLGAVAFALAPALSRADVVASTQGVLERRAPAIVFVTGVMAMEMSGRGRSMAREEKMDVQGVVVDPSGLVVTGGWVHLVQTVERSAPDVSIRFMPKNLKVVLGSDTSKEHDAIFVAHDTSAGVAFLHVLDLGDRRLEHVDLSEASPAALGDELFIVSRESRAFDFAPRVDRVRVVQRIERPRAMWGVRGNALEPGLALFDRGGVPVGFLAVHLGAEGFDPRNPKKSEIQSFLFPAPAVRASVAQALKRVPEAIERVRPPPAAPAADPVAPPPEPKTPEPPVPDPAK
jgi:hypothetical protein